MVRSFAIHSLILFASGVCAEPRPGVEVEADTVEWHEVTGELDFKGRVRLQWGPVELRCRRLKARRGPDGELHEATASGEISVVGRGWSATAGQARYDKVTETLELTDGPKIKRDGAFLVGQRMVLHLKSRRVVVESAKGRLPSPKALLGLVPGGTKP